LPVQQVSGSTEVTSTSAPNVSTGIVENVPVALANTEQAHTLPANTKQFLVKTRGIGHLKLAYSLGTSGTVYLTIDPGSAYQSPQFSAVSKTIYFQSPLAGLVLEIESWS
jgi:hypothetical protein